MDILFDRTRKFLQAARETYGNDNQILVAVEELNELSCVLTKYPRYNTHTKAVEELRARVLEECGDVLNVLDHIQAIFGITDEEMVLASAKKGDRLGKWLNQSDEIEQTTNDRDVPEKPCALCMYNGADPFIMPCFVCNTREGYKGFTPKSTINP